MVSLACEKRRSNKADVTRIVKICLVTLCSFQENVLTIFQPIQYPKVVAAGKGGCHAHLQRQSAQHLLCSLMVVEDRVAEVPL